MSAEVRAEVVKPFGNGANVDDGPEYPAPITCPLAASVVVVRPLLKFCNAVKVLLKLVATQLIPATHGKVTVSNCPVTPAAVMLYLYVPGNAQNPKFPFASAKKLLAAATEHVESVQRVGGIVGTNGEQGVPFPADVHSVIVAPGIGARNPCTERVALLSKRLP